MVSDKEIARFIDNQRSLQFYGTAKKAFRQVLQKIPSKEYKELTKNLIIIALHEKALGQVMHFPPKSRFKVMQLTIPDNIPLPVLRYVIAHELGHVKQGRNWRKRDGNKLEEEADETAEKWGFRKTKKIEQWIQRHRAKQKDLLIR